MKSDNELIAEFMGLNYNRKDIEWYNSEGLGMGANLQYQTSWDWLIPVLEKIESLGYYTSIFKDEDGQQVVILHPVPSYQRDENSVIVPNDPTKGNESKINTTYKTIIEFIRWHSNQPKIKMETKETLWTKLQFYLLYPFWLATDKDKRKPLNEFRHGLIPHKHDYDYSKPKYEKGIKLYRCKHYGCYAADAPEAIREMLNTVEEIKEMKEQLKKRL